MVKGSKHHSFYFGEVMHNRVRPLSHRFSYPVFVCLFDLDQLESLNQFGPLMRYNRPGLYSFHDEDHGERDGSPLRPWVEDQLVLAGHLDEIRRIQLICFPRVLGYSFNPISVYYCYSPSEELSAIVYEVKNTFGEQHAYVGMVDEGDGGRSFAAQKVEKCLHVSPFIDLSGTYQFRFNQPSHTLQLMIQHEIPGRSKLFTRLSGSRQPLSSANILKSVLVYPLLTVKVIGAIHFEALRLWIKGAKIHRHPSHAKKRPKMKIEARRRKNRLSS